MLKGSIVAIVTPFFEDGSVNYDKFQSLIQYHLANHTDGVVLLGTTAEATTLSLEEQEKLVSLGISLIDKKIPVIVGAGSNDTLEACKKAKLFSSLGADYILSITPYYNKTNEAGIIAHFEAIAASASCPIILYNVPSRTGMSIPISVIERLSEHPNIYGIKEASGNMSYASLISKYVNDDFIMLSGNDDIIVPMMSIGSVGVISVLANICPSLVHELCDLCLNEHYKKASTLQAKLLPLANALFIETNPIPVKEAMNYLGFEVGQYRLPLYPMSSSAKEALHRVLKEEKEWIR